MQQKQENDGYENQKKHIILIELNQKPHQNIKNII